jgi:DNA-directed RNA polymerase specialized sigma24 family protein
MSEGFERLLAALDPDRDKAGEEYERIRQRLMRLFIWRGCPNADELTDRTMERVSRRLDEGADIYTGNVYAFFHGVALMVLRESWREAGRAAAIAKDPTLMPIATPAAVGDDIDRERARERRLACLRRCLAAMPERSRNLLQAYHGQEGTAISARRQLAHALAVPLTTLRLRVHRLRSGLRACIEECLARAVME